MPTYIAGESAESSVVSRTIVTGEGRDSGVISRSFIAGIWPQSALIGGTTEGESAPPPSTTGAPQMMALL